MSDSPFKLDFEDEQSSGTRKWLPIAGALVLVGGLASAAVAVISMMSGTAAPQQPLVQQISIVQPPPPPPPPPKVEQPPEPEMQPVELDEPEPEALADDQSLDDLLGDELGLDAEGGAGSDAFGLRGKKGGRGLVGADPNAWYAGVLQKDLVAALSRDDTLRRGAYSITVRIWLDEDGTISRSELVSSTRDQALDEAVQRVLESGVRISQTPPEDLPQPIRLRISSRS